MQKISKLVQEVTHSLVERDSEVLSFFACLLSGEHILFLGPPGTGKSMLSDLACSAIDGATYFNCLLSKHTSPEELFGPLSLTALKQDSYVRVTEGYLPQAHIAFLDEIFKGSGALLNALLKITNERTFKNGTDTIKCPILTVVGASNELPDPDDNLSALYDRFLVRHWVDDIASTSNMMAVLQGLPNFVKTQVSLDEIEVMRQEVVTVQVSEEIFTYLLAIRQKIRNAGFYVSPRRWTKIVGWLKAYAYLTESDQVESAHLIAIADLLWEKPQNRSDIVEIINLVATSKVAKARKLVQMATALTDQLTQQATNADWSVEATTAIVQLDQMITEVKRIIHAVERESSTGSYSFRVCNDCIKKLEDMKSSVTEKLRYKLGFTDVS